MMIADLEPRQAAVLRKAFFAAARDEVRDDAGSGFAVLRGVRCTQVRQFEQVLAADERAALELALELVDRMEQGSNESASAAVRAFDAKVRQGVAEPQGPRLAPAAFAELKEALREGMRQLGPVRADDEDGVKVERDVGGGVMLETFLVFGAKAKLAKTSHALSRGGRRILSNVNLLHWRGLAATTNLMEHAGLRPPELARGFLLAVGRFEQKILPAVLRCVTDLDGTAS
jgi:hypothetical protein